MAGGGGTLESTTRPAWEAASELELSPSGTMHVETDALLEDALNTAENGRAASSKTVCAQGAARGLHSDLAWRRELAETCLHCLHPSPRRHSSRCPCFP